MKKLIPLVVFIFFISFSVVYGQEYKLLSNLPGVSKTTDFAGLVSALINIVIAIGVLLAVIVLAVGGFQYMLQDAVTTKESAKKTMTAAILGLIILLGSWLILYVINPGIVTDISFIRGEGSGISKPLSDLEEEERYDPTEEILVSRIFYKDEETGWKEADDHLNNVCDKNKTDAAINQANRDSPSKSFGDKIRFKKGSCTGIPYTSSYKCSRTITCVEN